MLEPFLDTRNLETLGHTLSVLSPCTIDLPNKIQDTQLNTNFRQTAVLKYKYFSNIAWEILILNNFSLFICNSNLSGDLVLLFAN